MTTRGKGRRNPSSDEALIIFNGDNGQQEAFFKLMFLPSKQRQEGGHSHLPVTGSIIFNGDNGHQEIFSRLMLVSQKVHPQRR